MRIPSINVRVVALWVLVGAALKLLYGTPAGLPRPIQELPLALGLTFRLVIAIEFTIGLLALVRPARGWLPLCILLGAFVSVLMKQVAAGDTSCGCFGDSITIHPAVMMGIDLLCLALVLGARPWRAGVTDPQGPWWLLLVLVAGAVTLPWVFDRETSSGEQITTGRGYTDLLVEEYEGKRFTDTVLAGLLPDELVLDDGLYVIWNPTCEVCQEHLEALYYSEQNGDRDVVLIESLLGGTEPEADEVKVKVFPEGEWIKRHRLPIEKDWLATPPVHIEVKDGKVAVCAWGMDALGK